MAKDCYSDRFRRIGIPTALDKQLVKYSIVATLVFLAVLSLVCGVSDVFFCGMYVNSGIGLWNGLVLITFAIYIGVMSHDVHISTTTLFITVIGATGAAMIYIGISTIVIGIFKGKRIPNDPISNFGHSIVERTDSVVSSCQHDIADNYEHLFSETIVDLIQSSTNFVLAAVGFLQLILAFLIAYGVRRLFRCSPTLAWFHVIFGCLAAIAGSVHLVYCCRYYYLGCGLWTGGFYIAAGVYQGRKHFPYKTVLLLLNLLSLVAAMTLVLLSTFGALCWTLNSHGDNFWHVTNSTMVLQCIEEKDDRFVLAKLANGNMYQKCFTGLEKMGYWEANENNRHFRPEAAWTQLKFTQLSACLLLMFIGASEIVVSILVLVKTCFTTNECYL